MPRFYVKTPDNVNDPHTTFVRHTRHLYKDLERARKTAQRHLGRVYDDTNKLVQDFWQEPKPEQPVDRQVLRVKRIEARLFLNAT